jgi:hypothetical protein
LELIDMAGWQVNPFVLPDFGDTVVEGRRAQQGQAMNALLIARQQREAQQDEAVNALVQQNGAALLGGGEGAKAAMAQLVAQGGARGLGVAAPFYQQEQNRYRTLTPQEAVAAGYRPGTVVRENAQGQAQVVQTPDTMSPEAMQQKLRLTAASHAPRISWSDVRDENGNIVAQRSSAGQYNPMPQQPNMFGGGANGLALQYMTRTAEAYAEGKLTPDQTRQFEAAVAIAQQPRTTFDPATGQAVTVTPPLPEFVSAAINARRSGQPAPRLGQQPPAPVAMPAEVSPPQQGAQPPQPGAAPQQPPMAPAGVPMAGGVPIGGSGFTASPPPPPGGGGVSVAQVAPKPTAGPTQADTTKLHQIEVDADSIKQALATFREARKNASGLELAQTGMGFPTPLMTTWTNAALLAKGEALYNLGVLNGPDLTLMRGVLSDPSTFKGLLSGDESIAKQIEKIEELLDTRVASARQNMGGQAAAAPRTAPASRAAPLNPLNLTLPKG